MKEKILFCQIEIDFFFSASQHKKQGCPLKLIAQDQQSVSIPQYYVMKKIK